MEISLRSWYITGQATTIHQGSTHWDSSWYKGQGEAKSEAQLEGQVWESGAEQEGAETMWKLEREDLGVGPERD